MIAHRMEATTTMCCTIKIAIKVVDILRELGVPAEAAATARFSHRLKEGEVVVEWEAAKTEHPFKDHHYSPDAQAQGDCRVCGHSENVPWHLGY